MKKLTIFTLLLCLILAMPLGAWAAPKTAYVSSDTQFATDGSCQVTLTMTLLLDNTDTLSITLPAEATDITLDGTTDYQLETESDQLILQVPVSAPGTRKLTICYRLKGLVTSTKEATTLTLPILSGLDFPVNHLDFSVTLPEPVSATPVLESGYYQQNLASILEYTTDGTTLTGKTKTALKDRETLVMTLEIPKNYFHAAPRSFQLPDGWELTMLILISLSILYFLLTLMPKFPGSPRRATVPDEIHAGDVGTCLTGCGTDLTMLVLSWAQMGYILIEMDHKDRVTLHKQMEMGNERSSYEIRWFKSLFGQRTMVDADSYHYAKLCRKLAAKSPIRNQLYDRKSGNPAIFRGLCCIAGMVAGLHMGLSAVESTGAKTLLGMVFACLCGIFSFFIQSGGKCLPLREKTPLWTALICSGIWIGLSGLCGDANRAVPMVIFQFVAGIAAAYGGKRSEMGLMCLRQIRGLRRHMTTATTFDLQQLLQKNPYYFYEMAPYALTLGVDRIFARRFGKMLLPEDSFLQCGAARSMTAAQFAARLRKAADVLNQRQKRLPYEQFRGK